VVFRPDGKRIVSGSDDNTLKVWDAENGQEVLTLKGHTESVEGVAYSPDGKRLVSGSHDNTLKVWDAEKDQEILTLKGHTSSVEGVTYSPDGKRISGKDATGKVLTWDATTGQLLPDARAVLVRQQRHAVNPDGSQSAFIENGQLKVVFSRDFVAVQEREEALDRAFLKRLARPDPAYHLQRARQFEYSGDLFAAAFHLRRLLLLDPKDAVVRRRLAAVQGKLDAQTKADAALPGEQPAKMPYAD
jgi:hypothetical protein